MKNYLIAFIITYIINVIGIGIIIYFNMFKFESFIMGAFLMAQTIKISEYIHSSKTESEKLKNGEK